MHNHIRQALFARDLAFRSWINSGTDEDRANYLSARNRTTQIYNLNVIFCQLVLPILARKNYGAIQKIRHNIESTQADFNASDFAIYLSSSNHNMDASD